MRRPQVPTGIEGGHREMLDWGSPGLAAWAQNNGGRPATHRSPYTGEGSAQLHQVAPRSIDRATTVPDPCGPTDLAVYVSARSSANRSNGGVGAFPLSPSASPLRRMSAPQEPGPRTGCVFRVPLNGKSGEKGRLAGFGEVPDDAEDDSLGAVEASGARAHGRPGSGHEHQRSGRPDRSGPSRSPYRT